MAILRLANLFTRQVLVQASLQQRQVAVFRFLQQRVHRFRLVGFEAVNVQRRQLRVVVAGHLTQRFNRVVEVVTRGDFVGQHGVVLGTGVLHVGNGNQAHVKTLSGLIQLTIDRLLLRFGIGERIDGAQHVKVGRGGVQNQRLLIGLIGDVLNTGLFFLQRQGAPF